MRFRRFCPLLLLLVCGLGTALLRAEQGCPGPPVPRSTQELNIFTEEQEMHLGAAMADHMQRNLRVIEEDQITAHLNRLGERLIKHMPPTKLHFQFFLVDLPVPNAFAIPGGRVYVSRKLVAFARSEDELAGLIAHEMGHIVTRQGAIDITRIFKDVLAVTQIGDRSDILEKYHQLIESTARNPKAFRESEKRRQQEQVAADQIAMYAAASAGYAPQAFVEFFDRLAQTEGKTGNWLTDFLGATRPESRRLREMLKTQATLPEGCLESLAKAPAEEFQKWQAAVVGYSGLGRKESLHAVLTKKTLNPPLRADINHIQFSPDGKYVLAQDDSSIFVLSRQPFVLLFRLDAPEAYPARFTPDSHSLVFHNSGLRVESWSIAEKERTGSHEVVVLGGCMQTALSPDGKVLACFEPDFDLTLFDVVSGEQVFQKKAFYAPTGLVEILLWTLSAMLADGKADFIHMGFSPDAHYFVAARRDSAIAVDLTSRQTVSVPGSVKPLLSGGFAFTGLDRLAGMNPYDGKKSAIVQFPSGKVLDRLTLGGESLTASGCGKYLILRPIKEHAVGVMNLETKKISLASKMSALDIYDGIYVRQRVSGELALFQADAPSQGPVARVTLPVSPLGHLRAVTFSDDLGWLAASERSRGAVWKLATGERIFHVRGFRGAYFDGAGTLYADFPKFEKTDRIIGKLDLSLRETASGEKIEESRALQYGPYLIVTKPAKKDGTLNKDVTLEVRDVRSGVTLWSRRCPREAPRIHVKWREDTMVLRWAVSDQAAKEEINKQPQWSKQLSAMREKEGAYFLEIVEVRSGKVLDGLLVETGRGSFRIEDVFAAGDWVVISDTLNRVLVYSRVTGKQLGRIFGNQPAISKSNRLLCVEIGSGEMAVYDLASLEKRDYFVFSGPVSFADFSADGKLLFVLTANQIAYILDLSSVASKPST